MTLTIFTPVFNRAGIIKVLYQSLCRQTCQDFEWVVVDDGSTDNIDDVMAQFQKDGKRKFPIVYKKQDNGGKHTAINTGVLVARGLYFMIVDSDDYLVDNAVEEVITAFIDCPKDYAGVGFQRIHSDGSLIGTTFDGDTCDVLASERYKYRINGDKAEVFFTEVMLKYPFPVFEGERFLSEASVWFHMAHDGLKIRWINKPTIVCEYLPGGLSDNSVKLGIENFEGITYSARIMLSCSLPLLVRLKTIGNYAFLGRKKGISYSELSHRIDVPIIEIIADYLLCSGKKRLHSKPKKGGFKWPLRL